MTRLHLYSDEPILATGLEALLAATGRFRLETFAGIPRLLACLAADVPDILLLDFTPGVTFGVLRDIRLAARECKLVLWVNTISTELAFQSMGLGVRGILRKALPTELLVKCLCKVQDGELWFEKALADGVLAAKAGGPQPARRPASHPAFIWFE
jgi:DNA-binding NarL/FixJ family response regulator